MFLWNMLGALVLIPALSYFLLPGNRAPNGRRARDGEATASSPGSGIATPKTAIL